MKERSHFSQGNFTQVIQFENSGSNWAVYLYKCLWAKNTKQTGDVSKGAITERIVNVPIFDVDGSVTSRVNHMAKFIDITDAVNEHRKSNGYMDPIYDSHYEGILPCGRNELLLRPAYEEAIRVLEKSEQLQGFMRSPDETEAEWLSRRPRKRDHFQSGFVFTGHPGIGKTFFLSQLLVHRLMAGLATVLQVGLPSDLKHILFDENGVRFIENSKNDNSFSRTDIWALADQKTHGILDQFDKIQWFTILTSSPKEENHKRFCKTRSATILYFPTWTWEEIVSAA